MLAETEAEELAGSFNLIGAVIGEAPKEIFDSSDYRFRLPSSFTSATIGTLKVNFIVSFLYCT